MGAGVTGPSEREYGAHQPRSGRLACECPPLAPRLCPGGGGALRTAHAFGKSPVPSFRPPPPLPFRLSSVPVTQHSPALRLPPETARGTLKETVWLSTQIWTWEGVPSSSPRHVTALCCLTYTPGFAHCNTGRPVHMAKISDVSEGMTRRVRGAAPADPAQIEEVTVTGQGCECRHRIPRRLLRPTL